MTYSEQFPSVETFEVPQHLSDWWFELTDEDFDRISRPDITMRDAQGHNVYTDVIVESAELAVFYDGLSQSMARRNRKAWWSGGHARDHVHLVQSERSDVGEQLLSMSFKGLENDYALKSAAHFSSDMTTFTAQLRMELPGFADVEAGDYQRGWYPYYNGFSSAMIEQTVLRRAQAGFWIADRQISTLGIVLSNPQVHFDEVDKPVPLTSRIAA